MQKTLKEIAQLVRGELIGDGNVVITGACGIKEASPGEITFLANPKYAPLADKTRGSAIIIARDAQIPNKPAIRVDNPSLAFTKVIDCFMPVDVCVPSGVHNTAVLGKNVVLGKNIGIAAYVVIKDNVIIGDNAIIYPGTFIGHDTKIGSDCLIYAHVSIRERILIGNRVIIHSGAVIGSDGFGFAAIDGQHHKIPQIGTVEICDDVEIGASTAIDRARFNKTVIGKGTKIDNLVHIAHNVVVGENTLIVAQAGISGSTVIGNNVIIAGQAGLVGHINIGDGAILAAQAGITKSVPANTMVSGYPARKHDEALHINACVQNLPKLYEQMKELKKKIEELEDKLRVKG
ncbi:MAG: UDP-3-O-(3-hydroxymyristoyl)glucosamine N-acyltransferase [Candidatus Omnitrophota bacterium]